VAAGAWCLSSSLQDVVECFELRIEVG
jgi:hypothetical protein